MSTEKSSEGAHAGLAINLAGLGTVRLSHAIVQNPETALYLTNHIGVVIKLFDLRCGKADEIGYGPYLNFKAELATYEEVQAIETLRWHVPTYYGGNIDYDRKFAFIAMEYLQGQNLRVWSEELLSVGHDAASLDELRRATQEVFAIVDLFHRQGIVLVDFKPDNVIRLDDGKVRLVDLGAFYSTRQHHDLKKFVYAATPDHAEVVIDSSNLQAGIPPSVASDIFSAGVALFEMATGTSRLLISPQTAEDMLALPATYLFRDSQINNTWRAFPHLKKELPLLHTQLRERQLLFSEFWHILKAYLTAKVADWASLGEEQQDQILLSTGTTFIMEQLPPALAWLAGPIARSTVLRNQRVPTMNGLAQLLLNPAPEDAVADVQEHNHLLKQLLSLGLPLDFVNRLSTWDLRQNPESGHWAVAAPAVCWELTDNAAFVYLRQTSSDEEGHTYWQAVEEDEADNLESGKAHLGLFTAIHTAWLV